jgi:manganese efflux pump family protein
MLALLLVAGSLGLNNLAASIAIGLSGVDRATRTRTALAFGLFEAGMPVVGLLAGRQLSHALGGAADISVAIIAVVSVGLSLLGLELGARLGARVEHRSELLSGIVLIAVGLAILTGLP